MKRIIILPFISFLFIIATVSCSRTPEQLAKRAIRTYLKESFPSSTITKLRISPLDTAYTSALEDKDLLYLANDWQSKMRESEFMYKLFDGVVCSIEELVEMLKAE